MDLEEKPRETPSSESVGEYLWDKSGQPNPEVLRLETLLTRFQQDRPAPVFPEIVDGARSRLFPLALRWPLAAATIAVVAVLVIAAFVIFRNNQIPSVVGGWDVSRQVGSAHISSVLGQVLETDKGSRVTLRDEDVGQIDVDPGTRLRWLNKGDDLKWMVLDRGSIHALIWAPPGQFVVDTPSAMAVDLGCAYALQVDSSGAGLVRTSLGWVGFKLNGRESFVPAGAACRTRPKLGPGSPYFEDASANFIAALARFDFDDATPEQRATDLAIVLKESRQRDALTLWHLLSRVDPPQRLLVYQRLRLLAPPEAGVTQQGILRLEQAMLDQWWNELGFEDIAIWRHWERSWSATNGAVDKK
jgi:hypothetical protein